MSGTGALHTWPPLLLKHVGTWEGHYKKINTRSGEVETHKSKVQIGVRGDNYSQRNTYTWEDGRQEVQEFAGRIVNGRLEVEGKRLVGYTVFISDDVIMFYADMRGNDIDVWECIRLLGEKNRVRTWQACNEREFFQFVIVQEKKTSSEDEYFEISPKPWD